MSSPKQPPLPVRNVTFAEAMLAGEPAALLLRVGEHRCAWAVFHWLGGSMTKDFADELVESFRDALYAHIRPQG